MAILARSGFFLPPIELPTLVGSFKDVCIPVVSKTAKLPRRPDLGLPRIGLGRARSGARRVQFRSFSTTYSPAVSSPVLFGPAQETSFKPEYYPVHRSSSAWVCGDTSNQIIPIIFNARTRTHSVRERYRLRAQELVLNYF